MRMLLKCSLLTIAAAGLVAAQHGGGGGHSGGGGHFGGGFHSSSHSSGGYSNFNSARSFSPAPAQPYVSSFPASSPRGYGGQLRNGWTPTTGARPVWGYPPVRRPIRPTRYGYYGFGFYPSLGFGYYGGDNGYDPYYDSGPGVPYAPPDQYAPYAAMPDPNIQNGLGSYYPPIPYDGGPPQQQQFAPYPDPAPAPPSTPIVLILKNGQKLEVENYAIMNGMFWVFTKQTSKRIPLANIDIAASVKATEDSGGSFPEEPFATNPN